MHVFDVNKRSENCVALRLPGLESALTPAAETRILDLSLAHLCETAPQRRHGCNPTYQSLPQQYSTLLDGETPPLPQRQRPTTARHAWEVRS
jgi:hypothetical protein